jgi:hypothetical protein
MTWGTAERAGVAAGHHRRLRRRRPRAGCDGRSGRQACGRASPALAGCERMAVEDGRPTESPADKLTDNLEVTQRAKALLAPRPGRTICPCRRNRVPGGRSSGKGWLLPVGRCVAWPATPSTSPRRRLCGTRSRPWPGCARPARRYTRPFARPWVKTTGWHLRDERSAGDAFQATFPAPAQGAGSIRRGASVGPWLYGAARRSPLRARTLDARRRARE